MDKKASKNQLLSPETQQSNEHDGTKKVLGNNKTSPVEHPQKIISQGENDSKISTQPKTDEVAKPSADPKITQPTDLPQTIFNVKINKQAIFDTIISERASRRQGTHKVKDRAEVSGGGKKPWRQKGTGRARAGSIRSPIWVGGGRVFGPTPERNYHLKVNKKVRKLALHSALSLKSEEQAILVHDFVLEKPSTKKLLMEIKDLNLNKNWKNFLIINENEIIFKSALNVKSIKVNKVNSLLVEDVVNADVIIFTKNAFERLVK